MVPPPAFLEVRVVLGRGTATGAGEGGAGVDGAERLRPLRAVVFLLAFRGPEGACDDGGGRPAFVRPTEK